MSAGEHALERAYVATGERVRVPVQRTGDAALIGILARFRRVRSRSRG